MFVDYFLAIKHAELARFAADAAREDAPGVTEWEHREYFDMA